MKVHLLIFRHLGEKSQLVIVKNAGHAINREKPREVCKLIRNFCVDSSVKVRDRHKVRDLFLLCLFNEAVRGADVRDEGKT